jgi:hypothetical protein
MQIRGVDCVILGITPFQYNPITKELIVYKDLRVRVDFEGGNRHFGDDVLRNIYWEPLLQGHLLNYGSLPKIDFYTPERMGRSGFEYIIIVPDDPIFIAWADTIKKWRKLQGISTEVYTTTQTGSSATQIETFLNNAYNTWSPRPVGFLILSDYPSTGDVYGITSPIWDSYCVSDNIYADVNNDDLPDMFHGRITAQSESQLSVMVRKFLNYERTPPTATNFYNEPLVACAWQSAGGIYNSPRWFQLCGEVIRGFFINSLGKNPARQYAIYDGTPTVGGPWSTATNTSTVVNYFYARGWLTSTTNPYDAAWWSNGSSTGITNAINSGAFMVQHRDHGYEQGWGEPAYSNSNINSLSNDNLTFVNSHNCLTGKYNYTSEVFAEKFHRHNVGGVPKGALGVNTPSEVSYSFVNDAYAWGMYDCLWQQFMPDYPSSDIIPASSLYPCAAMNYGKYFLQSSSWPYNTGDKVVTYNLFHHHGDVFNPLYTQVPQNLTISHASTLVAGATSFMVTANDSAIIALTVNNEIIGVGLGTGSPINITIPGQAAGNTMIVTVTKVNYYRYSASVSVTASNVPYVITGKTVLNDSAGNGQVNPGELINYGVYAKNVGGVRAGRVSGKLSETDAYMTVIRDSVWFGTIQANDSVLSNPYYQFRAANNCPNGRVVDFSLQFKDSLNNIWTSGFSVTVYAPDIRYQSYAVTGGNGNGVLDIGETANLIVTLKNQGGAVASNVNTRLTTTSPYLTLNDSIGNFGTISINNTATNSSDPYNVTVSSATPSGTNVQFFIIITSGVYCDTLDFSILINPYLENFESTNGNFVADPASAAWQWGSPTSGPNAAYSGTKLWATILSGNYSNNANWKLTSREFVASQNNPTLKFWHWYDFELYSGTAYDGGNVKISTDSMVTWTVLSPVGGYSYTAHTSTPGVGGEQIYCGSSNGWQEPVFILPVNAGQRFFIRWHFGSDASYRYAGWYLDDISGIGFTPFTGITKDVGVDAILYPSSQHQVSTSLQPVVRVKNYATATQANFQVTCTIVGAGSVIRHHNTQTVSSLTPGNTVQVNFTSWTPSVIEQCTIKIRTKLTGDQNAINDRMTRSFAVSDFIPPAIPALLAPVNNSTVITQTPQFFWQAISDAVQYNLVVSAEESEVINEYTSDTSFSASNFTNGNYNWSVRAKDAVGNWSDFSSEWNFMLISASPGWSQKSDFPSRIAGKYVKDGGSLVAANTETDNAPYPVFAFRGYKSNEFYRYDTSWQRMESIPFGNKPLTSDINKKRVGKGAALCCDSDNTIYATKGSSTRELWAYQISENKWRFLSYIPNPPVKAFKGGTALAFKNGKVYVLVGGLKVGYDNFFAYDTLEKTWSALERAPTADGKAFKDGSCVVVLGDTVFALKGKAKENWFYAYDVNQNTWSGRQKMDLIHPSIGKVKKVKDGGSMTTDGSVIYATKGGGSNEFWQYTPGISSWSALDLIPKLNNNNKSVPKAGAALGYDGLHICLLKGNKLKEFWQYFPYTTSTSIPIASRTSRVIQTIYLNNNRLVSKITVYPNPLSSESRIDFTVRIQNRVQLKLYDNLGYLIVEIFNQELEPGNYSLSISRSALKIPAGVYHLQYDAGEGIQTVKIIVR